MSESRRARALDAPPDVRVHARGRRARARGIARRSRAPTTSAKNDALLAIAARHPPRRRLACWPRTRATSPRRKAAGSDAAFVDRLTLTPASIAAMAEGLEQIAALRDPVGEISDLQYRPTGIQVGKMRVPLGVVGIIYESRPNVTADAAALCLKSGNACILRGGSEALHSQPGHRRVRARRLVRGRPAGRPRCR